MVEEGSRCTVCQAEDHQVGCGGNSDRINRHNCLQDSLCSASQSAALVPRREVPSLILGSYSHPADVCTPLPHWKRAILDVSMISTLQQQIVHGASIIYYGEKSGCAEPCNSVGVTFISMLVESSGSWSPSVVCIHLG